MKDINKIPNVFVGIVERSRSYSHHIAPENLFVTIFIYLRPFLPDVTDDPGPLDGLVHRLEVRGEHQGELAAPLARVTRRDDPQMGRESEPLHWDLGLEKDSKVQFVLLGCQEVLQVSGQGELLI